MQEEWIESVQEEWIESVHSEKERRVEGRRRVVHMCVYMCVCVCVHVCVCVCIHLSGVHVELTASFLIESCCIMRTCCANDCPGSTQVSPIFTSHSWP